MKTDPPTREPRIPDAPPFDQPLEVPVFPLSGALLLPDSRLPLHIFEPRYRNMVRDALDGDKLIGMIQPRQPENDPSPLFAVGCLGEIESHLQLAGGRCRILLRGLRRFESVAELDSHNGYRRLAVRFDTLAGDDPSAVEEASDRLIALLAELGLDRRLAIDLDRLRPLSGLELLNTLSIALPFSPVEKQALLEAHDVAGRLALLVSLLRMGLEPDRQHHVAH